MTAEDRVLEMKKRMLSERLRRGAKILGRLWRDGHRCAWGWAGKCTAAEMGRGDPFCAAKKKWVELLKELHDGWPFDLTGQEPYAVIEAMALSQFEASGLTAIVEVPGARRPIRFGNQGTYWWTLLELAIANDPEAIESVVRVQETL